MITLVEKKPLIFKIRMAITKFFVNQKIKYTSKRGGSSVTITCLNNMVKEELKNYYSDKGFGTWGGNLSVYLKIEWRITKK